jgi:hypothetical protein
MNRPVPEPVPAAVAVGMLLAPVVACLRDDHEGVAVLLDGACEDGVAGDALRAAPAVVRVYLRLAPPPDGADKIVATYAEGARRRFDRDAFTVGAECLEVARVPPAIAGIADAVFADVAGAHGDRCALEGVVASCWWCAQLSAELRNVDPVEETAAICRYLSRVA